MWTILLYNYINYTSEAYIKVRWPVILSNKLHWEKNYFTWINYIHIYFRQQKHLNIFHKDIKTNKQTNRATYFQKSTIYQKVLVEALQSRKVEGRHTSSMGWDLVHFEYFRTKTRTKYMDFIYFIHQHTWSFGQKTKQSN